MVIDIGSRDTRRVLIGGLVAALLGVPTLIMIAVAVPQARGDDWVGLLIGGVIGLGFTGIAVLALVNWKMVSRPRKLVFEPAGIRWDDPRGKPWAVAWGELAAVSISRTAERPVQLSDAVVRRVMVRLDLFPGDDGFRARHPELEHLWELHRCV